MKEGLPPNAGGMLDQPDAWLRLYRYIRGEIAAAELEQLNHGKQ